MISDNNVYDQEVAPRASSTIETLRSVGYSPETALADLVDNSITAGAKTVELHFEWAGPESFITVIDDGRGMSSPELIEAMRLGSGDPRRRRPPGDLGRFGMGLKTASFSQCRRLTVVTRKLGYAATCACWDLDEVVRSDRWKLIRSFGPPVVLERLGTTGTAVVWEQMDRLVGTSASAGHGAEGEFWRMGKRVVDHLAMVFHRYIEGGRLTIRVNGETVEPWNPFLPEEKGGQALADESFLSGRVRVRSYVLPHLSKLTSNARRRAEGIRGMAGMQGFYVYRAERMLVAGSWLGLARRHEDTKLARILVDISSEDDEAWQIDIKKSVARPPSSLKGDLDRLARQAQAASRRVYRHRGARLGGVQKGPTKPMWDEVTRRGVRSYRINREHPAIKLWLGSASGAVEPVLRMIEETVPVAQIYAGIAEGTSEPPEPLAGEGDERVIEMMRSVYDGLRNASSPSSAAEVLAMMDPFNRYPALVDRFLRSIDS